VPLRDANVRIGPLALMENYHNLLPGR
jgi:hypothetical protein